MSLRNLVRTSAPAIGFAGLVGHFAGHRQTAFENDLGNRFPAALDPELAARELSGLAGLKSG